MKLSPIAAKRTRGITVAAMESAGIGDVGEDGVLMALLLCGRSETVRLREPVTNLRPPQVKFALRSPNRAAMAV
ncbi:hypothetical protein nbrc107697_07200 [Gordonia crocea]|uniref:Uncharacterized protein n=1 Tax=Gordonia crocea TaxID=589162 RepID=A0A7M3SVK7_9ACTN|nr:hypothetical protein nbrc107697_07200 [Gordonia crocea]